jgi:hypothetical protein
VRISCQYLPFVQTEDIRLKSAVLGKNPLAMKKLMGIFLETRIREGDWEKFGMKGNPYQSAHNEGYRS